MLRELHDQALRAAIGGATVVTPNSRASRSLQRASAVHFRELSHVAWQTPDILPLGAFYQRLWTDATASGIVATAILSEPRCQALWRKIISASAPVIMNPGATAAEAQSAWTTLHQFAIPLDKPDFRVTAESRAFCDWAISFAKECERGGWVDSASLPHELDLVLDKLSPSLPKRIVFYGFDALTPQARNFCDALGQVGIRVDRLLPSAPADREMTRQVRAIDSRDELSLAARWARRLLESNPKLQIGVVVPNLAELRRGAEEIFAQVIHPEEFLFHEAIAPRSFEVASGPPLSDYSLAADALQILRFATSEIPISDVGTLLRSPWVGNESEASTRALFEVAIRSMRRPHYSVDTFVATAALVRPDVARPADFLQRCRQLGAIVRANSQPLAFSRATAVFAELLKAAGWPGERKRNSAEFQILDKWDQLLCDFASLDGFVSPQPAYFCVDELARMAGNTRFRPENIGAPVQIMDVGETEGSVFDCLWVCGFSDDSWPPRRPVTPYIPIALQTASGVPAAASASQRAEAAGLLARYTRSATQVVLSWPANDGERELRRAHLLGRRGSPVDIEEAASADLCGPAPATCASVQRREASLEYLDDSTAPAADPLHLAHRGTSLLTYQSRCPFRAFAELRLGARGADAPEIGLHRRDRGNLVDAALEEMWKRLENQDRITGGIPDDEVRRALDHAVAAAFDRCWPSTSDAWSERMRQLEWRRLRALLDLWLAVERKRTWFEVVHRQEKFEFEISGVRLHGRADRIDRLRDGSFVVIDYKSGTAPRPREWQSDRPNEPQIPLYATWQSFGCNHQVSAAAFGQLNPREPRFLGYGTDKTILGLTRMETTGESFTQQIAHWHGVLEKLTKEFIAGHAAVDPKDRPVGATSTCTRCHLHAVCRVAELSFPDTDDDAPADEFGDADE